MNDKQTLERYRYLASQWGFTPKQVDEASRYVFNCLQTYTQAEFEMAMRVHLIHKYNPTKMSLPKMERDSANDFLNFRHDTSLTFDVSVCNLPVVFCSST